ncbi:MAG: hypothetical protein Q4D71_08975 [Oscillospiraceae bacterium]|nr:hypothetical protein [Oscillospiraceae bacterium]
MENSEKEKANADYASLRSLYVDMVIQRENNLRESKKGYGLDGENHYKDIDDWYKSELKKIKEKYGI